MTTNPKDKADLGNEKGYSGTLVFNGIITQEEYNKDLIGRKALEKYDIMRRSDATVRAALLACKLPILSTTWTVEAASDDPTHILQADFVRRELMGRAIDFTSFLREALLMFDFGYSVAEKVYAPTVYNGSTLIGCDKIGFRKQRSIFRWETEDGQPGITQYVVGGGGEASIPLEKLIIFTNDQEGENYEGISMLRGAFKHWDIKDKLYLIDAIKQERQALGIMDVVVPDGASEADITDAVEFAKNARANEQGYIKRPVGWEIAFMDMKANTTSDVMPSVLHHDRQIVKNVLAQFLELGAQKGGGGSHALSSDHSRLFEQSLEAAAKNAASRLQKQFINQLVDLNWTTDVYPTLEHAKLGADDIQVLSEALNKLVTSELITPDAGVEEYLRNIMHLPDMPEEYVTDYANRPKVNASPAPAAVPIDTNNAGGKTGDNEQLTADDAITNAILARSQLLGAVDAEYAKG